MSAISHLDAAARDWVVLHRLATLDVPMQYVSAIGWWGVVWLVLAAILAAFKTIRWSNALRVLVAVAIAIVISDDLLKPLIGRPRPFTASSAARVIGDEPKSASFPSGHATTAFAGAAALARSLPGWGVAWWTLAAVIAYSRVYLGVHYPLDVAAGALLGVLSAQLAMRWRRGDDGRTA